MDVTLTWSEVCIAAEVGKQRQIQNVRRGAGHGDGDDGWTRHVEGCAGEMSIAKLLNVYWSGNVGDMKAGDVGRLQVRTRSRAGYDLPIKREDADDDIFVLAVGLSPRFRAVGWMLARDGKRPEFWRQDMPRPAFFVPQSKLRPMDELIKPRSAVI